MEWIYKKIWELKSKALTLETKERIQRLQQLLDNPTTSEKVGNNNSANSPKLKVKKDSKEESKETEKDIDTFLFNRYNR
jgi:hypothetical protein